MRVLKNTLNVCANDPTFLTECVQFFERKNTLFEFLLYKINNGKFITNIMCKALLK